MAREKCAGFNTLSFHHQGVAGTHRRLMNPVTPHGFRSSFRDWAAEETSFPAEVAETALAHKI
jgi:integrase